MSKENDEFAKAAAAAAKAVAGEVTVIMLCALVGDGKKIEAGDDVTVDEAEAERLIGLGAARRKEDVKDA